MKVLITRQPTHRRNQITEIAKEVFGPELSIETVLVTGPSLHDRPSETPLARHLMDMYQDLSTVEDIARAIVAMNPDVIVTRNMIDFNAPEVMRLLDQDLQDRVIIYNPNPAMNWNDPICQRVWRSLGFTKGAVNVEDLRHELRKYLKEVG